MKKGVAVLSERRDARSEIVLDIAGDSALVKIDSTVVGGVDLLKDAQVGARFEIEYYFTPSGDADTGLYVTKILGAA